MGEQKAPVPIKKEKILLVEGKDEEYLFCELLKDLHLDDIQVIGMGGKDQFPPTIQKYKRTVSEFERVTSIGIVRDADNDPHSAFQSVCSALHKANLPEPNSPLLPVSGPPQVNIMIIPSIYEQGMIENVCLDSVSDDPAMECVDQYFECLEARYRILSENNVPKSRVRMYLIKNKWLEIAHFEYVQKCMENYEPIIPTSPAVAAIELDTFLASRYTPDLRMGEAAQKSDREDRYWNFDHPAFDEIKRFIRML